MLWLNVGAGALGIILTTILQSASEDILAVGLAGLAGYASVLNLPARRSKVKAKLEQRASKFSQVQPQRHALEWMCMTLCDYFRLHV